MDSQRVKDRLVGAAVAVLVLLLIAFVVLWSITQPVGEDRTTALPPPTGPDRSRAAQPPSDLAEGETWMSQMVLDASTLATPDLLLTGVDAIGRDVRTGERGLHAGWMSVDATVPFDVVAEQLGEGMVVGPGPDGQASIVRTFPFAGRQLVVEATGTVEVSGGTLVIEPQSIDVGGPVVLAGAIAAVARRFVTIEHDIEGIPEGLVLQDVTVQDDGFRAELQGRDVRLVP